MVVMVAPTGWVVGIVCLGGMGEIRSGRGRGRSAARGGWFRGESSVVVCGGLPSDGLFRGFHDGWDLQSSGRDHSSRTALCGGSETTMDRTGEIGYRSIGQCSEKEE